MPRHEHRQNQIIADFLAVSRRHLTQPRRPRPVWRSIRRIRLNLLRTLLIAGSIGSLSGNAAYAAEDGNRQAESRRAHSTARGSTSAERGSPAAIERMP